MKELFLYTLCGAMDSFHGRSYIFYNYEKSWSLILKICPALHCFIFSSFNCYFIDFGSYTYILFFSSLLLFPNWEDFTIWTSSLLIHSMVILPVSPITYPWWFLIPQIFSYSLYNFVDIYTRILVSCLQVY